MLAFPSAPQHVWHPPQGHRELAKITFFLRTARLNSTNRLFQNPQIPPRALPMHNVIHIHWSTFLSGIFILTSWNDTSSPRVRQHLFSSLHLTHGLNRLTKSKGKIYKTKSLGHYITQFNSTAIIFLLTIKDHIIMFVKILFSQRHLFVLPLNIKQFFLPIDGAFSVT